MTRTLNQRMADSHEQDIAEWIGGRQQKASGSQWHAQGDAKNGEHLTPFPITADGKSTLGKSIAISRDMWKKIVEQTFGQDPALFLRFYQDESLRTVDADLAVVDARFFRDLLEKARLFEDWENRVREDLAEVERKRHPLLEVSIPEPTTGCTCCR